MVAPSYEGPTAVGVCPKGHKVTVADLKSFRDGPDTASGWCPGCEQLREFSIWRGPVTTVGGD